MKSTKPTYNKYLQLNKILNAQDRLSEVLDKPIHDEMLFIIIHQIYELWFKQIIHEIDSIIYYFKNQKVTETNINTIVGRLNRIHDIQKIAITQIDILKSMTPMDFLEFRDLLNPASGFQSTQFRIIENALGLKTDSRIKFSKQKYTDFLSKTEVKIVEKYEQKNIFDLVEEWLERTPFIESEEFNFWESYKKAIKKMLDDDLEIIYKNPNLDKSFAAYMMALEINPKHIGAHEYLGELYLMLGELEKSKIMLNKLGLLAGIESEEYFDLKSLIDNF